MTRVLFTGYAPVHFVCFQPVYDVLVNDPDVEVLVSGGIRYHEPAGERRHDTAALYRQFDLKPETVVDVADLADLDVDVLVSSHTKPIPPRSYGQSLEMFHGLSFRNRAVRSEQHHYDHYFVLGPYQRHRLQQRGVLEPGRTTGVDIGFPKTDRLLDGSIDLAAVRAELGFTGDRPVVMYAPTGAHDNSLETFGVDAIRALAATGDYNILVKPHDHPKKDIDWYERLAPLETEHLRLLRAADSIPALVASDVLISDASSIANEWLLLDRPLVFLDVPELLTAAATEDDRLDLETWGRKGGLVARDAASTVRAVANSVAHPHEGSAIRRRIAEDLFYNPGTATEAAVTWLRTTLGLAR